MDVLQTYFEEVFVEDLFRGVIVIDHPAVEGGDLLGLLAQPHRFAVVIELDVGRQRVVSRGEKRSAMFEELPLGSVVLLLLLFPPFPHLGLVLFALPALGRALGRGGRNGFLFLHLGFTAAVFVLLIPAAGFRGFFFALSFGRWCAVIVVVVVFIRFKVFIILVLLFDLSLL